MKISKLTPSLEVSNIRETSSFYEKHLSFQIVMAVPKSQDRIDQEFLPDTEYVYVMMKKDTIEIFFQRTDTFKEDVVFAQDLPIGASISIYMDIVGIKQFHKELVSKNLEITDLKTTWYGMQEFYLKDLNGYILGFAEKAEES